MTDILIKNCHILDGRASAGYIENQDILIHEKIIQRISPSDATHTAKRVINGQNMLAIPGIINAHTHSIENVLRGGSERLPLELWLIQQSAFRAAIPPRLVYLIALAGAAEMLRSGTTAALDHFWMAGPMTSSGLDAVMQAYADIGMRVSLAPMLEDCDLIAKAMMAANPRLASVWEDETGRPDATALLELVEDFVSRWQGQSEGRLRCLPGPGGPQWCSEALLTGCQALADRFGSGLHIHLAETEIQSRVCRQAYGHPVVFEMDRLGVLKPETSVAHCIWVDDAELDILARTHTKVIHNPVSNLKLGSGIAPVPAMLRRGIQVALGTDGAASNDNQNMFAVLKLTALLHSPVTKSDHWLEAQEVLEMATQAGAGVLGYHQNELGGLREGCLADIALLDLSQVPVEPLPNAAVYLVYVETGASVRHVIVNGQLVVENGQVLTIPEADILLELRDQMCAYNTSYPRPAGKIQALMAECAHALSQMIDEETGQNG
jgi:cytosine/adenosine deaminase-related metal-dependent hydrolase